MARPRQPASLLELKGSFRKDPQRRRPPEPGPGGPLGEAPLHLDADAREIWGEIASILPDGVIGAADRVIVEMVSCLVAEFRKDPAGMQTSRMSILKSCLASLGMSPCDRAKLSIPEKKAVNPFEAMGFKP